MAIPTKFLLPQNRGQGTHSRKRSLADLYQRLKKYTPHISPLRECKDDILPLADFFLQLANEEFEKQTKGFDAETKKQLLTYT